MNFWQLIQDGITAWNGGNKFSAAMKFLEAALAIGRLVNPTTTQGVMRATACPDTEEACIKELQAAAQADTAVNPARLLKILQVLISLLF